MATTTRTLLEKLHLNILECASCGRKLFFYKSYEEHIETDLHARLKKIEGILRVLFHDGSQTREVHVVYYKVDLHTITDIITDWEIQHDTLIELRTESPYDGPRKQSVNLLEEK